MTSPAATVVALSISDRKGIPKRNVDAAVFREEWGIEGDAHAGPGHRQISLLADESIDKMRAQGLAVKPGAFAENITTAGLDLPALPVGTRMMIGEVELEVTQIGKECHSKCAIYARVGDCVMPREGIFARVLRGGRVQPGDPIRIVPAQP